jgi:hypothetical protein
MKNPPLNSHQGKGLSPGAHRDMEKWVPLGTPRETAEIIPFRRKTLPTAAEAVEARIRYLRSIAEGRSQPFEERMRATVWAAELADRQRWRR